MDVDGLFYFPRWPALAPFTSTSNDRKLNPHSFRMFGGLLVCVDVRQTHSSRLMNAWIGWVGASFCTTWTERKLATISFRTRAKSFFAGLVFRRNCHFRPIKLTLLRSSHFCCWLLYWWATGLLCLQNESNSRYARVVAAFILVVVVVELL